MEKTLEGNVKEFLASTENLEPELNLENQTSNIIENQILYELQMSVFHDEIQVQIYLEIMKNLSFNLTFSTTVLSTAPKWGHSCILYVFLSKFHPY